MSCEATDRPGEFDRRKAIKYGSIAAGLVVATPSILTLGASPASASGRVANQFGYSGTSNAGTSAEATPSGLAGTGLVVVTVALPSEKASGNTSVSSSTNNTWTLVTGSYKTNTSPAFTMATYYTVLDGSQTSCNFKFTWSGGSRAAIAGTYFPTGSTVHSIVQKSAPSASTSITAPSGLVIPSRPTDSPAVLFCGAMLRTGANAPTYTIPTGFGNQANVIYSAYGTTGGTSGIGAGHAYYPTDAMWDAGTKIPSTDNYGAVSATAGASIMNCATMICVY